MQGRRVASAACIVALVATVIGGCSSGTHARTTPTVRLRMDGTGALPANLVVIRVRGISQDRHEPEQWIVDRVLQALPGSRSATVNFLGLSDGRIVEADCLAAPDSAKSCGETGLVSEDVLELLGLQRIDRTISKEMGGVAFDGDALSAGRMRLRVDGSTVELGGVHGLTSYRWLGLPSVWVPSIQPVSGVFLSPFAVVVAAPLPLTDQQFAAIAGLGAEVIQNEQDVAAARPNSISSGCVAKGDPPPRPAVAPTGPASTLDTCASAPYLDRSLGAYTEIYTARSDRAG